MLSFSAWLTRPAALATSVALHFGAVIVGGHARSEGFESRAVSGAPIEVEVIAEAPPAPVAAPTTDELLEPALARPRSGALDTPPGTPRAGHHHAYPVAPDHDAHPHDPSLIHMVGGAPPAPPLEATAIVTAAFPPTSSAETPLHFALAVPSSVTARGAKEDAPGESAVATGGSNVPPAGTFDPILLESTVDVPARLQSSVPVVYPEAARAAEIEADVLLELVVDSDGRVASARPLAAHALGLTDAAVRAVRAYRFTPARRVGRPVRVRMRWTVAFRLQ